MATTTFFDGSLTRTWSGKSLSKCAEELHGHYLQILHEQKLARWESLEFKKMLGFGGQGVVFLANRVGADGFTLPVAIKILSPERFDTKEKYDETMRYQAHISSQVARIQHNNLLDVHHWVDSNGIRIMEMEYVDGFDINELLCNEMYEYIQSRASAKRWEYLNEVVVTKGYGQKYPRLKPGVAIAIVRECLLALSALHRQGIVHGDIKPSNIMLKRTGNAKIIDIGAAFEEKQPPRKPLCSPTYAAPEVLAGARATPQSDLASLGYVVIEMLSGISPFEAHANYKDLIDAKTFLPQKMVGFLPKEVVSNELLMNFCRKLIASEPSRRFQSAEAANYLHEGAVSFQRQLIRGNLASEYDNDIRVWLSELEDYEPSK